MMYGFQQWQVNWGNCVRSEWYILYRQHENNVVGVKKITVFGTLKSQIEKLVGKKPRNGRSMLAYELIKGYPGDKT